MEQIRHGRDTWAQFDNEDDDRPLRINQHENSSHIPYPAPKFQPGWAALASTDPCQSIKLEDVQSKPTSAVHLINHLAQQFRNHQLPTTNWNPTSTDDHQTHRNFKSTTTLTATTHTISVATTATSAASAAATTTTTTTTTDNSVSSHPTSIPAVLDPWAVTSEQKAYYLAQFLRLQPDPRSKLDGLQSKTFFELSQLPVDDLSRIWELADVDQDGQLTLGEFCAAMHLVVLRRNGVPIPALLPQALVELITANPLSSSSLSSVAATTATTTATLPPNNVTTHHHHKVKNKLEKQTSEPNPPSPCGLSNSSEPDRANSPTPATGQPGQENSTQFDHANSKLTNSQASNFGEHRQRRWSISSQSDVCSLAEGMLLFESRPNLDAQLKHPIPLRVRAPIPAQNIAEPCPENLVQLGRPSDKSDTNPTQLPQSYHFPAAFAPDTSLTRTIPSPNHRRRPDRLRSDLTPPKSNDLAILVASSSLPTHKKCSAPATLSPPPPPPRAHLNLETVTSNAKSSNAFGTQTLTDGDGVIQNNYSQEPNTLSKSSLQMDKDKVIELQHQCDAVTQVNEQLANELMKLQKDRIALKILLERLMPLDAA